jgi:hypothetical protein
VISGSITVLKGSSIRLRNPSFLNDDCIGQSIKESGEASDTFIGTKGELSCTSLRDHHGKKLSISIERNDCTALTRLG